jgi:4-hydroxybenzoate polyprenyltransferase
MQKMQNKFLYIAKLMRLNSPTGALLVFWPATFGLLMTVPDPTDLRFLMLFLVGSVFSRGAGCVINDILDHQIDASVERTKNRPIAKGDVTIFEGLLILFLMLIVCFSLLLFLSITSIVVGLIALFMTILYPLMKRLTYFPQVFLGLTFNLGCLIAYAAIIDEITTNALVMYVGCCFWTIGYDTIYAFMDIKDDKRVGVKSTAIFFERQYYRLFIMGCYLAFAILFISANLETGNSMAIKACGFCMMILFWQVHTLDIDKPMNCLARFRSNNLVGLILAVAMLLGVLWK